MKFKSDEEIQEVPEEKKCECPICKSLKIANTQIDLIYSILNSLRSTIDNIGKFHEEHDSQ
jgi:hypothetical protein